MIALGQIDGLQDIKIHRVLDIAARIAWRELQVGNDCITRVVRVELAERRAAQLFISAYASKRLSFEGRRFDGCNVDSGNTWCFRRIRPAVTAGKYSYGG